ncbi:ankyrin repeat domain-containing protein [Formosa sp. S-31]|uniref:ankyrin repeat domain-containing protein n=1 Tax=Formosa sp. S-31 TaxID=2790949 RepID=UPI003EB79E0A
MKKSTVIIAIALGFLTTSIQAANVFTDPNTDSFEIGMTKSEVNLLCTSIAKGDIDIVKKLIAMGEDVNERSNGLTPAMYAARHNRVEILQLLIANGADLEKKCAKGHTAIEYAESTNALEAKALIEKVLAMK